MKKLISIFITAFLLIACISVNSFAYTDYVFSPTDFSVTMQNQRAVQGGAVTDYSNTIVFGTFSNSGINYITFHNSDSNYYSSGYVKSTILVRLTDLSLTHEYNFKVYSRMLAVVNYSTAYELIDSSGQVLAVLHYGAFYGNVNNLDEFNFSLDSLGLSTNSGIFLRLVYEVGSNYQYNWTIGISDITLRDLDDDTGFFESIINWVKNVASNVTQIGSNIVSSVTNGLSNLGNNLNTWLTGVKDGITNKLESVKTSIQNSIDNIQNWFVNLGDRISDFFTMLKNYLLYFRHPVTVNSDGVPVDSSGNPIYTNPFESALNDVKTQFEEWIDNINDFIDSIGSSADSVSTQLSTFKLIYERFSAAVPWISGVILFAVIFFVIRKIVGR